MRGVETSSDGAVTVSVNVQAGWKTSSSAAAADSLNRAELADAVLRTSRTAAHPRGPAGADALAPLIGADSAAMSIRCARTSRTTPRWARVSTAPDPDGLNEEESEQVTGSAGSPAPATPASLPRPQFVDDDDDVAGYTRGD